MQEKTYRVKLKIDWRSLFWDLVRSIPVVFMLSLLICHGADIYYKQNIWDRRKWIGQSLDYNGGNQDAGLQMMLYFSSYELPPYITRGNIHEEDSMMISEVPITLMKGVYDDAEYLFYDFKFEYDSLYVCGTMRITRRDEKQFSSDEEKKEWIGFILEKMFWSSPA